MTNIPEGHPDFKTFERTVFEIMCLIACELIRQYLEWRDLTIMALRDTKEYRLIDSRESTIKTLMGEVRYSRRYYKRRAGGYVFLLDEAMGISDGYGLVSENLAEQIVIESTEKSFRKTSEGISSNTGQRISAMGAWNVVQQYGEAIEQQEARLHELYDSGSAGHLGNISTPVIFEEFDDVWVSRQHETRRKKGQPADPKEKKRKKIGKKPMHIGMAYTGWKQSKDGRYSTADKIAYASFGSSDAFTSAFETLLYNFYDMDAVVQRVTNGDGESWIRTTSETNGTILQLDPYHRNQAIITAVAGKADKREIFKALRGKEIDKTISTIGELVFEAEDDKAIEKLIGLYNYFDNNRDILLTWNERGIELPAPPEGITYRNMGAMESNNNCLITQRMKHRKGSWTEKGANHMAKILCFRGTVGLDSIFVGLPEPQDTGHWIYPLSAAQAPKHDGKGYGADWLYAEMPFEQALKTNGREAIRNMLRLRPLSELPFLRGS